MGNIKSIIRIMFYKFGVAGMVMISGFLVPGYLSVSDNGIYKLTQLYFQLAYTYLSGYSWFFNFGLNRKGLDRQQTVAVIMRIYLGILMGVGALLVVALFLTRYNGVFIDAAFAIATVPAAVMFTVATKLVQALNEISWLNRLNLVQGLLFLLMAILLTVLGRHPGWVQSHLLWLTMLAWLVSYVVAAGLAFIAAAKLGGVSFRPGRYPEIAKLVFPYGNRVSLQQLLTQFNLRGDLMLVGILAGTRASGLYAVSVTASEVLWHISSSISLLIYTRVAKEERKNSIALTERTFRFTILLLIVSGLGLAVVFPPIIHFLLKGRYDEAIPAFYILILGSVAYGTTQLFTQFFTDQLGKVRFPMYMQAASIATNVLVCFLLIPRIYIYGGAVASTAAYYVGLAMNIGYFRMQTGRSLRSLLLFTRDDLALLGLRSRRQQSDKAASAVLRASESDVAGASEPETTGSETRIVDPDVAGLCASPEQAIAPATDEQSKTLNLEVTEINGVEQLIQDGFYREKLESYKQELHNVMQILGESYKDNQLLMDQAIEQLQHSVNDLHHFVKITAKENVEKAREEAEKNDTSISK